MSVGRFVDVHTIYDLNLSAFHADFAQARFECFLPFHRPDGFVVAAQICGGGRRIVREIAVIREDASGYGEQGEVRQNA